MKTTTKGRGSNAKRGKVKLAKSTLKNLDVGDSKRVKGGALAFHTKSGCNDGCK